MYVDSVIARSMPSLAPSRIIPYETGVLVPLAGRTNDVVRALSS